MNTKPADRMKSAAIRGNGPDDENMPERLDERCSCGNLVAKLTVRTVEIKCRRCKRIKIINIENVPERFEMPGRAPEREKAGAT